jgi:hypothetical protein
MRAPKPLVLNSTYTASLNANQDSNPGGSITLTTALPTGSSLIITSAIAQTQGVQVTDLGGFYPAVLNALHDRITILTQQLQEQIDRCVKYSITDPALLATLPAVPTRKGMLLGFDPTSGDAVAVAGAVNPSSGPFLGNLVGNVTSTGVSSFKRVNGLRYLEGYGAVCDGSTDDSTALAAAIADVVATGSILVIPAGKTCSFSTPQVITSGNFGIVGGAGATLKYTGAGIAITIDGHLLTNGARNVVLRDFAIDAPTATTALKTLKVTSSMFSNLSVRGCTGTAFIFDFAVSNLYEHLNCSVNDGAFTATPTGGILLTNAGGGSSNNTFINPRIEGINGDGIVFHATQANTIYGGTTEANIGRGLYLSGACALNTFIGMDIEANGGTPEVQVGDGTNACRHTKFTNTTVQNQITISNNAKETTIDGGSYLTIVINAGALATTITNGVQYGTLTDNGTATQRFSENAATPNTLGATNFKGAATFTASPVFPNDIPLQAVPSTGGLLNLLWLTAADQSLLQYVATKAMKVRNSSSVTQLTVDDAGTTVAGTLVAQAGVNLNTKPWISQTAPNHRQRIRNLSIDNGQQRNRGNSRQRRDGRDSIKRRDHDADHFRGHGMDVFRREHNGACCAPRGRHRPNGFDGGQHHDREPDEEYRRCRGLDSLRHRSHHRVRLLRNGLTSITGRLAHEHSRPYAARITRERQTRPLPVGGGSDHNHRLRRHGSRYVRLGEDDRRRAAAANQGTTAQLRQSSGNGRCEGVAQADRRQAR